MEIRTVRHGLAALAIAIILGLAGAGPASAAGPGWLEQSLRWLADLWSADEAQAGGGGEPLSIWELEIVDRGYGMDPNGGEVPEFTPPGQGQ